MKLYQEEENGIRCLICPHNCLIKDGCKGICKNRANENGRLKILTEVSGLAVDPIEKKPLYHFFPNKKILSVGAYGCNLGCEFCQNWQISQTEPLKHKVATPEEISSLACSLEDNIGVAFTYNEPTVFYEFVYKTALLVKKHGLKNVLVTNGYINKEPAERLLKLTDAVNLDIKSIDSSFYVKYCKAELEPVLEFAKIAKGFAHLEITNLIIPTLNDSDSHIKRLALWIKETLGKDTPLHLSAYFPCYKMDIPSGDMDSLCRLQKTALEYLDYVYMGNLHILKR